MSSIDHLTYPQLGRQVGNAGHINDHNNLVAKVNEIVDAINSGSGGGGGGGNAAVIFVQTTPALTWTIAHHFGRLPNVVVYDTSDRPVEVDYTCDDVNAYLSFVAPSTGTAVLT